MSDDFHLDRLLQGRDKMSHREKEAVLQQVQRQRRERKASNRIISEGGGSIGPVQLRAAAVRIGE